MIQILNINQIVNRMMKMKGNRGKLERNNWFKQKKMKKEYRDEVG